MESNFVSKENRENDTPYTIYTIRKRTRIRNNPSIISKNTQDLHRSKLKQNVYGQISDLADSKLSGNVGSVLLVDG